MKRKVRLLLLFLFILLLALVGCQSDSKEAINETENEPVDQSIEEKNSDNDEKEVLPTEIKVEEAEEIIQKNYKEIDQSMKELQEEKTEWFYEDWTDDPSLDVEASEEAFEIISEKLEGLVSAEGLRENGYGFLEIYWCECDAYRVITFEEPIRLQVIDQENDWFKASYIVFGDALMGTGGTRIVEYVKEEDQWKLHAQDWLAPEEEPLNITFEDVKAYLKENQLTFVEEIEEDGEKYIVSKADENGESFYYVFNTRDSSINVEQMEKYNENGDEKRE